MAIDNKGQLVRRMLMVPAVAVLLVVCQVRPCVQMGSNFWNLNWQGGYGDYCTGSWGNWSPAFLNELKIYGVLRFMDWNMVSNLAATPWDQRVQKSAGCTQCSNACTSIAYEWQIDLVNKVPGCGYWLTVPPRGSIPLGNVSGPQTVFDLRGAAVGETNSPVSVLSKRSPGVYFVKQSTDHGIHVGRHYTSVNMQQGR